MEDSPRDEGACCLHIYLNVSPMISLVELHGSAYLEIPRMEP